MAKQTANTSPGKMIKVQRVIKHNKGFRIMATSC